MRHWLHPLWPQRNTRPAAAAVITPLGSAPVDRLTSVVVVVWRLSPIAVEFHRSPPGL